MHITVGWFKFFIIYQHKSFLKQNVSCVFKIRGIKEIPAKRLSSISLFDLSQVFILSGSFFHTVETDDKTLTDRLDHIMAKDKFV